MTGKIKFIEDYTRKVLFDRVTHDFTHADRVRKWALYIAKKDGFKDLEIIEATALLHDIGRDSEKEKRMHGKRGAEIAHKFLHENSLFSRTEIKEIVNAIRFHNSNRKGNGRLLEILRDADILDLLGAIGIMRGIASKHSRKGYNPNNPKGETWNMTTKEFDRKIDNKVAIGTYIVDQLNFQISCYHNLTTKTAKEIAKPLTKYVKGYILQLDSEIKNSQDILKQH